MTLSPLSPKREAFGRFARHATMFARTVRRHSRDDIAVRAVIGEPDTTELVPGSGKVQAMNRFRRLRRCKMTTSNCSDWPWSAPNTSGSAASNRASSSNTAIMSGPFSTRFAHGGPLTQGVRERAVGYGVEPEARLRPSWSTNTAVFVREQSCVHCWPDLVFDSDPGKLHRHLIAALPRPLQVDEHDPHLPNFPCGGSRGQRSYDRSQGSTWTRLDDAHRPEGVTLLRQVLADESTRHGCDPASEACQFATCNKKSCVCIRWLAASASHTIRLGCGW